MSLPATVKFIELNGEPFIEPIVIDNTLKYKINELLLTYKGPNDDYIKLIYNDIILNTTYIFNVDGNFIIPTNDVNIYVVKSYKKYVFCAETNMVLLFNKYNDDYYFKILDLLYLDGISDNYILEASYYNIIKTCIYQHGDMLQFATDNIKNDYEIVFQAVRLSVHALNYASDDMKNNYEIVFRAVQNDGNALEYASDDMKNNYVIVLAAVTQNGNALEYASDDMKNNYDIVLAAVKQNKYALNYASENMKTTLLN